MAQLRNVEAETMEFKMSETGLLKDKVILVTGAGSGIGVGIAVRLAEEGAKVVITNRSERGRQTYDLIKNGGGECIYLTMDITNEESIRAAVTEAVKTYGRLDGAVNNAGAQQSGSYNITDIPESDWDKIMNTDLKGVWLSMKHEIPAILDAGGGSIINITSNTSLVTLGPGSSYYRAAKAGAVALTKAASLEYAHHEKGVIRINSIAPGAVMSDAVREAMSGGGSGMWEIVETRTAMKRVADPREIGDLCIFLASDRSKFITGANIVIDGGVVI